MGRRSRTATRWTLQVVIFFLALAALYILVLAFPYPLFAHQASFGEFHVFSSRPLPPDMEDTMDDVRSRLASMERPLPGAEYRIFFCDDHGRYSFFALLTRRTPNSLALGLSAFRNVYLNVEKIQRMAEQNPWGIRHSRFEGNIAEAIAHEIAHFHIVREIGYRMAMNMPEWKSEGYAEYQANVAAIRADPTYSLENRISLLLEAPWPSGSIARRQYEWQILVEYLGETRGYGLNELLEARVTEESVLRDMLEWYRERQSKGRSALTDPPCDSVAIASANR